MGFAAFERGRGAIKEARGVYKRCYARNLQFASGGDAAEALCAAWLMLERECGTAEEYAQADAKARFAGGRAGGDEGRGLAFSLSKQYGFRC